MRKYADLVSTVLAAAALAAAMLLSPWSTRIDAPSTPGPAASAPGINPTPPGAEDAANRNRMQTANTEPRF